MELFCQIVIPILSALVAYNVTQMDRKKRLFGYCSGLISQPLWYVTTLSHHQYGLFILSLWYTWRWIEGIRTHWKKNKSKYGITKKYDMGRNLYTIPCLVPEMKMEVLCIAGSPDDERMKKLYEEVE